MHSLGTQTLERTGYVVTPAAVVVGTVQKVEAAIIDDLTAYENGELAPSKVCELFQELVDSGLVWQLQGHYGRTAVALIQEGVVTA